MKIRNSIFIILIAGTILSAFNSCKKENLFRSESEIRNSIKGTWYLYAIPTNDTIRNPNIPNTYTLSPHIESWTFSDANVDIIVNANSFTASYSVSTSTTKAKIKLENLSDQQQAARYEGTWQIVKLNDEFLAIANDKEGTTGLLQLEFHKNK